jgi:transposase-like protein
MYARGMTTRDIQGHLKEIYGVDVAPSLISEVTDAVIEEVKTWQTRPLEPLYPIVFMDALMVKMRHDGRVENRAVHVAIGIDLEGRKDVLGLVAGNRSGIDTARRVVQLLEQAGHEVLTRHLVDDNAWEADRQITPKEIYLRDMNWLRECDLFIAEVSGSSFGLVSKLGTCWVQAKNERFCSIDARLKRAYPF